MLQQLGRNREALERLQEAARLQPQNYEVWYDIGVLQHETFGRDKAARAALRRALGLNPLDAASRYELERTRPVRGRGGARRAGPRPRLW